MSGPSNPTLPTGTAQENVFQEDIAAILRALGLGDHARPTSPHNVVLNEIIPAIHRLRSGLPAGTKDAFDGNDSLKWRGWLYAVLNREHSIEDVSRVFDAIVDAVNARMRSALPAGTASGAPLSDNAIWERAQQIAITMRGWAAVDQMQDQQPNFATVRVEVIRDLLDRASPPSAARSDGEAGTFWSRVGKAVNIPSGDPQRCAENVEELRRKYNAMCDRLHDAVARHKIGRGGEHVDQLVIDELNRLARATDARTEGET